MLHILAAAVVRLYVTSSVLHVTLVQATVKASVLTPG